VEDVMLKQLRPAIVSLLLLTLLNGVAYPLLVTGIAKVAFGREADGSLLPRGGSELIGQSFDDPKYFWGRPSATSPVPYNGGASSGSNLGPSNPALADAVKTRVEALRAVDSSNSSPVPVELVTTSASGLDPDVSPAAAEYQVARVARARKMSQSRVRELVGLATKQRQFGILGEPRVNVLKLNLSLDGEPSARPAEHDRLISRG
jgi:K+-transporting ATPase ATPase C chain